MNADQDTTTEPLFTDDERRELLDADVVDDAALESIEAAPRVTTDDTGARTIAAMREIVARKQYAMVDRVLVDMQTASAIVLVYDALNDENKVKFAALPIAKMGAVAWKFIK